MANFFWHLLHTPIEEWLLVHWPLIYWSSRDHRDLQRSCFFSWKLCHSVNPCINTFPMLQIIKERTFQIAAKHLCACTYTQIYIPNKVNMLLYSRIDFHSEKCTILASHELLKGKIPYLWHVCRGLSSQMKADILWRFPSLISDTS